MSETDTKKRVCDTLVCGGGTAGIAAALASARNGAKTMLIEKEYALGGLATLGLITVYLPLCDGNGYQMSGGICEELALASIKYGGAKIPDRWIDENGNRTRRAAAERAGQRYSIAYSAPSLMMAAEELLREEGVEIFYDVRLSGAKVSNGRIDSVYAETKRGRIEIEARSYVDATGDADLCFFAGEPTEECSDNRRTGWYWSYGADGLRLNGLTDPLYGEPPEGSRKYNGCDIDDIASHMTDMRRFIAADIREKRLNGDTEAYPAVIPAFHGLRTTRKMSGGREFSEHKDEGLYFHDAVGMIGSWKRSGPRYTVPLRAVEARDIVNLYAAGRCCRCSKSGWDLLRVIPSCAVTGQASGTAASMQALSAGGLRPGYGALLPRLLDGGVLLDRKFFDRFEEA